MMSTAYGSGVTVTTLLFLRFALASLFFFGYLFLKTKKWGINKQQVFSLLLLGGVIYTMEAGFFYYSVKYIPVSLAILLLYLSPVFVVILSFFVNKEKVSLKLFAAITLSLLGLILILGSPSGNFNIMGAGVAICSSIAYACFIVFGDKIGFKVTPAITSAFLTLFASLSFLIGGLFTNTLDFKFDASGWFSIISIVLFSSVFAFFTFFLESKQWGQRRHPFFP